MKRLSATVRITIALTFIVTTVVLFAQVFKLIPNRQAAVVEGRVALCESVSISASAMASRGDLAGIEISLNQILKRNPDLVSAGVRRNDGKLVVDAGNHALHWHPDGEPAERASHLFVPIARGRETWGAVELCFQPLTRGGFWGWLEMPLIRLLLFVTPTFFLAALLFLRRTLRHLNPSKVVPRRIRQTLDTLTGGLLVLDQSERIVLANRSFSETVGLTPEQLQGRKASQLDWKVNEAGTGVGDLPWDLTLRDGTVRESALLTYHSNGASKTFLVNAAPIVGDDGRRRGVFTSFDDVTALKKKQIELTEMLDLLRNSRDEVRRQNDELRAIAMRDPLTHCLNRRSLFERFEDQWSKSSRWNRPLSCVMVDIDHFKSVNDTHGHLAGDEVLKHVAATLKTVAGKSDIVARYGGEEFCIVLPEQSIDEAARVGERFREAIESIQIPGIPVTASLGVSEAGFGARDAQQLLEQADRCLYVAKRGGRNQVARWDFVGDLTELDSAPAAPADEFHDDGLPDIPFHAVTALISALAYRHADSAEHSRRVADLCVATARDLMSVREAYVLEIAALLHDIGKIGVPDAILLKPGPLDADEWEVMVAHDRIGIEIVRTTFDCDRLSRIIETHHAWFGGNPRNPGLPTGDDIPVGSRILAIADAYDAIISNRVYRKGRGPDEAFAELRRCAGIQFDPCLVDRFIQAVQARDANRRRESFPIGKQAALRFGQQIERLTDALERHDMAGLATLAGRLHGTAEQCGVAELGELAAQLQQAAAADDDMKSIVELTRDLLDLCRVAQQDYLDHRHRVERTDEADFAAPQTSLLA